MKNENRCNCIKCFFCRCKSITNMVLKTKTDLFLLAYILFLICALFLYPSWNNHFASTIIAAVSISGAFFSLAELFYTIQKLKNEKINQSCELLRLSIKAMNNLLDERKKMLDAMSKEMCPHWEPRDDLSETEKKELKTRIERQTEYVKNAYAEYENKYEDTQKTIKEIQSGIDKMKQKISNNSVPGNILMVIGILLFLLIMTFENTEMIIAVSPYLTIAAFALVMINYFVKQVYSANNTLDIDALREKYDN